MKNIKYNLASSTWGEEEKKAILEVLDSEKFTMGEKVYGFEKDFASYIGTNYSVMVNSGSSANLLMIAALFCKKENPLKPGDEVIVPAVSWSTTFTPLQQYGLKLKFIDVDLETLNIDINQVEENINENTKLIFGVNLLGNPIDFDRINKIINEREIYLIEDNCESLGAKYKGKKTGTFGLMASHSSFFSHHICTMEGGLITTDDEELYHILLSLRAHGWTRNLPKENKLTPISNNKFEESFKFILPGYNLRPLEMSGAIGIEQLKKIESLISKRRDNGKHFLETFTNSTNFKIQKEVGESSFFGFSLILKKGSKYSNRNEVLNILEKSGVEYRPIVTGNFTKNPVIKYFDYSIGSQGLENSMEIDQSGFFIGNHHYDVKSKIKIIKSLID